jgi:hypothetical protein
LHLAARLAQRTRDRADVAAMGLQRGHELFASLDLAALRGGVDVRVGSADRPGSADRGGAARGVDGVISVRPGARASRVSTRARSLPAAAERPASPARTISTIDCPSTIETAPCYSPATSVAPAAAGDSRSGTQFQSVLPHPLLSHRAIGAPSLLGERFAGPCEPCHSGALRRRRPVAWAGSHPAIPAWPSTPSNPDPSLRRRVGRR